MGPIWLGLMLSTDQRHGKGMPLQEHEYMHDARGPKLITNNNEQTSESFAWMITVRDRSLFMGGGRF